MSSRIIGKARNFQPEFTVNLTSHLQNNATLQGRIALIFCLAFNLELVEILAKKRISTYQYETL
ncbi:hypothetical protein NMYAN_120124 [Nitrosomonas nitrosa]|uniref:Uncharacterized protein n=1 Tax=Nitrosomonas nitrosa TaxID=52442 RepID=A0A8H9D850_9PROT|nr:hypothetical protein NMYAN_120124 [Nitrosomonas nitrosa]